MGEAEPQVPPAGLGAAGTGLSPRQPHAGSTVLVCSSEFVTGTVASGRSVLQLLQLELGVQDCSSCLEEQWPALAERA